jgi:CrcB protein
MTRETDSKGRVTVVSEVLYVAAGGAIGAGLRYGVGAWMTERANGSFPWHTLLVNVSGAFLLGVLMAAIGDRGGGPSPWQLFAGVGLLGGYTTFSTFSYESITLLQEGAMAAAAGYVVGSLVLGLAAAGLGVMVGRAT